MRSKRNLSRLWLIGLICWIFILPAAAKEPEVKCVLAVPPDTEPWPDAQERLNLVLKDAQWWYSCQMEAYGYGPKTFALETDAQGKVVVHIVRLKEALTEDEDTVPLAMKKAADQAVGNSTQRQGSIVVMVYNGYYWTDQNAHKIRAGGRGLAGQWANFTGWHFFSVNPQGWSSDVSVPDLPDENPFFPPLHTKILRAATGDGVRTVAARTSSGHAVFIHEIGHAFGLHHPASGSRKIVGDVMDSDFWQARGSFVESIRNEWLCLSATDAAVLNRNPLFKERNVAAPSSGAPRSVGMRGAQNAAAQIQSERCAPIRVTGKGFTLERLKQGELSQANRNYVWLDGPAEWENFSFTRLSGGATPNNAATIRVRSTGKGRIYLMSGEERSAILTAAGWQLLPITLTYGTPDRKRTFSMFLYYREVAADSELTIPQAGWTGTAILIPTPR